MNPGLVQVVMLSAFSGGMFYAFGLLASDYKHLGGYRQSSINLLAGLSYVFVTVIQLPFSAITRQWPVIVARCCWFLTSLGWLGFTLVSFYSPLPLWCLIPCIGAVGVGLGLGSSPTVAVFLEKVDPNSKPYRRWLTAYITMYALSSCFGGIIYQYALESFPLRIRLTWFCAAQTVLSFVVALDGLFFFKRPLPSVEPTPVDESPPVTIEEGEDAPKMPQWLGIKTIFFSVPCWLMFFITLLNFGVSINFYNNSGSMLETLRGGHTQMSILFLVFGLSQCLGRIGGGEFMAVLTTKSTDPGVADGRWAGNPEFAILAVHAMAALAILISAIFSALWNNPIVFFFYVGANALAYGALWSLAYDVAQPSNMFGASAKASLADFYQLYGFFVLATGIGPVIFDPLSGYLYDALATNDACFGVKCYRTYGFVVTGVQVVCLTLILVLATIFYKRSKGNESEERRPLLNLETETVNGGRK